jgi:DnaJ-class molecular chaperone
MDKIMEKELNRDVYREFHVKEVTCNQCGGNGYVMVTLNADPVPLDCKQCDNQGVVYKKCSSMDNGHIFEIRGPHIVSGSKN